jgi:hypothetical protein
LNKNASKWQNTAHDNGGNWSCVKVLIWYLARNLIGSHWVLDHSFFEAQVRAEKDERRAHAEPEGEQNDKR